MKIKHQRNFIIIIFFITVIFTFTVMAENNDLWFQKNDNADVYIFPLTPLENPDEWKELESHNEMLQVTQIPDSILQQISTSGLIETCFNYPLFGDMFAYNSYIQGLESLNDSFNGFRELYERGDIAREMIKIYKRLDLKSAVDSNDPYYSIRLNFIDYFISQEVVLSRFNEEERYELLIAAVSAMEKKTQNFSKTLPIEANIYLIACIMRIEDKELDATLSSFENNLILGQGKINTEIAEVIINKLLEGGYIND